MHMDPYGEMDSTQAFPAKLFTLLENGGNAIGWLPKGDSFAIFDQAKFAELLPVYFKHKKLSSFQRQLNLYGFRRDKEEGSYYHPCFIRRRRDLVHQIRRVPNKGSTYANDDIYKSMSNNNLADMVTDADVLAARLNVRRSMSGSDIMLMGASRSYSCVPFSSAMESIPQHGHGTRAKGRQTAIRKSKSSDQLRAEVEGLGGHDELFNCGHMQPAKRSRTDLDAVQLHAEPDLQYEHFDNSQHEFRMRQTQQFHLQQLQLQEQQEQRQQQQSQYPLQAYPYDFDDLFDVAGTSSKTDASSLTIYRGSNSDNNSRTSTASDSGGSSNSNRRSSSGSSGGGSSSSSSSSSSSNGSRGNRLGLGLSSNGSWGNNRNLQMGTSTRGDTNMQQHQQSPSSQNDVGSLQLLEIGTNMPLGSSSGTAQGHSSSSSWDQSGHHCALPVATGVVPLIEVSQINAPEATYSRHSSLQPKRVNNLISSEDLELLTMLGSTKPDEDSSVGTVRGYPTHTDAGHSDDGFSDDWFFACAEGLCGDEYVLPAVS